MKSSVNPGVGSLLLVFGIAWCMAMAGCGSKESSNNVSGTSSSGTSSGTSGTSSTATLTSISVTAPSLSISTGATDQFTAKGSYNNGTTQTLTNQVSWSSSSTAVAKVSASGLATAVGAGTTTIQASLGGVNGSTSLTVSGSSGGGSSGGGSSGGGSTNSGFAGVLTQHNDNARTGQNLNETQLTTANVNTPAFGKLFSVPVDGYIYAQPLYVPNVSIAGGTHNVVYVATEGDSVFAFDADSGASLWQASLIDSAHGGTPGETPGDTLDDLGCTDLVPQVGITSTPVIDPTVGAIYVETKSKQSNGNYIHRLHMIDMTTGAEQSSSPTVITATVAGTSDGGTTDTFNPLYQLNRPGLLLMNGQVYLGYASHCDDTPYHGWLFAYDASALTQTSVFITTPNGEGQGGIWMGGTGIAADSSGNIFVPFGNGNYDATDLGDSVVKLVQSGSTLSFTDYFTPFDQGNDDANDFDVGGGGLLLLPDQSGAHPHELILGTKGGDIYLIDRDQMTTNNQHYCAGCTSDPEIVQEILNAGVAEWVMTGPAYWNGNVYFGFNSPLQAYTLTNGALSNTPSSSSPETFGFPGTAPAVSANGTSNGIVWLIDAANANVPAPAVLYAYDATNLANELWNSSQAANNRDAAGNAVKFSVPTIANGKVYIGTQTELDVYGLF
jgi:Big-like domain-containing protein